MGRQINFYMSREDQFEIDAVMHAKMPELVVLRHRTTKPELQLVNGTLDNTLEVKVMYLALKSQIEEVVFKNESSQDWYHIDQLRSPVIEYSRSTMPPNDPRGNVLRRGRLYYQPSHFDESDALVHKNPEFLKSAQKIFGLFKRNLTLVKDSGLYFGEGALKLE